MLISIHDFAGEQGHFCGVETQICDQIVIDAFDFVRPIIVSCV